MCSSQIIGENFMDKQMRERKQEWEEKKCVDSWLWHRKLKMLINTRFASKVIMFKEHFKLKKSIIMC
jgi:hypothetical protein